jgi:hypothetical protein
MTQTERLVAYLRSHPGASGLEIIAALALPKYTSRISDARAAGVQIVCERRSDGFRGYRVVEPRAPLTGEQIGAFGS